MQRMTLSFQKQRSCAFLCIEEQPAVQRRVGERERFPDFYAAAAKNRGNLTGAVLKPFIKAPPEIGGGDAFRWRFCFDGERVLVLFLECHGRFLSDRGESIRGKRFTGMDLDYLSHINFNLLESNILA